MARKNSTSNLFLASAAALIAAASTLAVTSASAQSVSTYTEYAAKFLCGTPSSQTVTAGTIEPGDYSTSINIHNPNIFSSDKPISFLKKAVIAKREGVTFVPPSAFAQDSLPNDYSESVDCTIIRKLLGKSASAAPAFIEGFVVIIAPPAGSPNQLDVVGVYTSSNNPPTSLQVVPIAPRIIAPPASGAATLDGILP
jgi:hypothetical protein